MTPDSNICNTEDNFLLLSCQQLGYDDHVFELLSTASREIRLELPLRKDDGSVVVYNAYRVQHHDSRGPFKGGLRFHPTVTMEECRGLAVLMSLKSSLMNIPLGGAKGGVDCDPSSLSDHELEQLTRKFVEKIHRNIGPTLDIPAPDVGTNPQIMAWIQNEYSKIYGYTPAVVTGKPVATGGSQGREEATGCGVHIILQEYARARKKQLTDKTVVIQGFGNVGSNAASFLEQAGMRIIAISDSHGGIFNDAGLDIENVVAHKRKSGTVAGAKESESIDSTTLLELECDFLIPAALSAVIDESIAERIQAGMVVEAANSPITYQGNHILDQRGIPVLPDILVNAGGVIVSYFEWVQNIQQFSWPLKTIQQRLREKLHIASGEVFKLARQEKCSFRSAAYRIAISRLKEAFFAVGF